MNNQIIRKSVTILLGLVLFANVAFGLPWKIQNINPENPRVLQFAFDVIDNLYTPADSDYSNLQEDTNDTYRNYKWFNASEVIDSLNLYVRLKEIQDPAEIKINIKHKGANNRTEEYQLDPNLIYPLINGNLLENLKQNINELCYRNHAHTGEYTSTIPDQNVINRCTIETIHLNHKSLGNFTEKRIYDPDKQITYIIYLKNRVGNPLNRVAHAPYKNYVMSFYRDDQNTITRMHKESNQPFAPQFYTKISSLPPELQIFFNTTYLITGHTFPSLIDSDRKDFGIRTVGYSQKYNKHNICVSLPGMIVFHADKIVEFGAFTWIFQFDPEPRNYNPQDHTAENIYFNDARYKYVCIHRSFLTDVRNMDDKNKTLDKFIRFARDEETKETFETKNILTDKRIKKIEGMPSIYTFGTDIWLPQIPVMQPIAPQVPQAEPQAGPDYDSEDQQLARTLANNNYDEALRITKNKALDKNPEFDPEDDYTASMYTTKNKYWLRYVNNDKNRANDALIQIARAPRSPSDILHVLNSRLAYFNYTENGKNAIQIAIENQNYEVACMLIIWARKHNLPLIPPSIQPRVMSKVFKNNTLI